MRSSMFKYTVSKFNKVSIALLNLVLISRITQARFGNFITVYDLLSEEVKANIRELDDV